MLSIQMLMSLWAVSGLGVVRNSAVYVFQMLLLEHMCMGSLGPEPMSEMAGSQGISST